MKQTKISYFKHTFYVLCGGMVDIRHRASYIGHTWFTSELYLLLNVTVWKRRGTKGCGDPTMILRLVIHCNGPRKQYCLVSMIENSLGYPSHPSRLGPSGSCLKCMRDSSESRGPASARDRTSLGTYKLYTLNICSAKGLLYLYNKLLEI